jgi:hypothetical protein
MSEPTVVIHQGRAAPETAEMRAAMRTLQQEPHQRRYETWNRVMSGGIIVCRSWNAAINERQRLYMTRNLLQKAYGASPFDNLVIRLEKGDNKLTVQEGVSNITEIIPSENGEMIGKTYVIPAEQGQLEELPPERSRAPLGFEPEEPQE